MFVSNFRILILVSVLFFGCKSSKTQQVSIQEKYFEVFQKRNVTSGHYGGYFILDGTKRIYKLHLSDDEEIIVESDFEEGQVVYSDADFYKHMVILYNGNDVFRVVKGNVNIYSYKDKIEVNINVLGIKDKWELVADSIPRVEDGNHHNVVFGGKLKPKEMPKEK